MSLQHAIHVLGSSPHVPPALRDRVDEYGTCCAGAAIYGVDRCTCWEPIYDLEQQPLANDVPPKEIPTQSKCCEDCAYRNGSPERSEEDGTERLLEIAYTDGQEFWCHQGCRRVVAFRHSETGEILPAGDGDYRPPIGPEERPVVWKADGTVAARCAGWNAHRGDV